MVSRSHWTGRSHRNMSNTCLLGLLSSHKFDSWDCRADSRDSRDPSIHTFHRQVCTCPRQCPSCIPYDKLCMLWQLDRIRSILGHSGCMLQQMRGSSLACMSDRRSKYQCMSSRERCMASSLQRCLCMRCETRSLQGSILVLCHSPYGCHLVYRIYSCFLCRCI